MRALNKEREEGRKKSYKKNFTKEENIEYVKHYMEITKETIEEGANNLTISNPNRKVNHISFSVTPIITCGKECDGCFKYCYDMKAYIQYRDTRHSRNRNLLLSQKDDFVERMTKELEWCDNRHFRLHVGGDFYNQEYVNKWFEIIKKTPHIKFYAFTKKAFALDLATNKPKNLILIGSIDNYDSEVVNKETYRERGLDKVARVVKDGKLLNSGKEVKDGFTCQGGVNKDIGCGKGCDRCYKTKRFDIINFELH